jgi:hypothetical protein
VVLVFGEAGIGKSSPVEATPERLPMIDHLARIKADRDQDNAFRRYQNIRPS